MKDEALSPVGFIMENLRVQLPSSTLCDKITTLAGALCRLTNDKYTEEEDFLESLALLNGGAADRRALNWLARSEDDFASLVARSSTTPLSAAAKRELAALKTTSGEALVQLRQEQLRLEEEVATLVEDAYELSGEERKLLHSTRPVRDPLDVLKGVRPASEGSAEQITPL
jgi:hypothetical protein